MKDNIMLGMIASAKDKQSFVKVSELEADYVDLHFEREEELMESIKEAERLALKVIINIEGRPLDWEPSLQLRDYLKNNDTFLGFMLDECDHMQLNAHWPVVEYYGYGGRHYFADTDGLTLDEAQEAVEKGMKDRVQKLKIDGKDVAGEYLYPGMMHTAARAGLSASPKILKETYGPVMIAAGLGASLQYGGCFGIDCDAWWHPETVGHTDKRVESSLKLAYWAGADRIYMEGGFGVCGHPSETVQPQLLKQFAKEYLSDRTRGYSWRDYRPEVAIIRQDDTCFDIRQKHPGEYPGPLYGHISAKEENTEWLNLLNLLSHGYVRNDSASHNWECRSILARTLFAPFYKLVIFDETVTGTILDSIKLFFLTGPKISPDTMEEVRKKVKEGAACVIPERLAPKIISEEVAVLDDGDGKWIIVKDFYSLHYETWTSGPCNEILRRELMPLIGDGDTLVYDFGQCIVEAAPRRTSVGDCKIYGCREIPRAVSEAEDELEFVKLEKSGGI